MGINRSVQLVTATAALATAFTAVAGPAVADTQRHKDPRGDVHTVSKAEPEPGADIVNLRNTYEGRTLTVSLTTADLLAKGYEAQWSIQTPDERSYTLTYDRSRRKAQVTLQDSLGPVTCEGLSAAAKDDTITATVPRRCINGADAVQIAGITIVFGENSNDVDDSRQDGIVIPVQQFGPTLERN